MEIAVFAKKRTTTDGRPFYGYLATLTKKDGSPLTVAVKFRDDCGAPKPENCPMNIKFQKGAANLSSKEYVREDTGETANSYTLWVSAWEVGSPYVDTSLDDFE